MGSDLVHAERLQMIGLMVVMFMSYSLMVSVILVLWGVDLFQGMGMEFWNKNGVEAKCQQSDTTGI